MKKRISIFVFAMAMLLLTCKTDVYAESFSISRSKATMNVGDVIDLDVTGTDKKVTWISYNENIASVDEEGIIKAHRTGKTTVRARVGFGYKTCSVNVVKPTIKINKSTATIYTGGTSTNTAQLNATVKGANKEVTWNSSNEAVAVVDRKGKVTSVSGGNAFITVSANGVSTSCKVTVKESSISLNMDAIQLSTKGAGSSIKLTPTVTGSSKKVKWTTSDKKIATVSNGKVTGKKDGKATITATANGVSASCEVTVIGGLVSINEEKVVLYTGEEKQLKTNAGKHDDVNWESSNNKVATVENGKVKAVRQGTATISVSANDKTDSCEVTVKKTSTNIEEGIVFLKTKGENKTYTLNYDIIGRKSSVTWKTSDKNVVTVSKGKLTAQKAGTATVTATANGITDTVTVTVTDYNPTINLNQSDYTLYTKKGNTVTLKAAVDGSNKKVTWASSNPTVADIKNGKVTAKKAGTTLITATANEVTAECFITVKESRVLLGTANIQLKKGEKAELPVDVIGYSQSVKYATTSSKVATVKNGVITAKGAGEADIKVTANGITAICHIIVSDCVHSFEEGIVTKEATCSEEGVKEIHCANCEYYYKETIPATEHSYKETNKVPALCLNRGIVTYTCEICADTRQEILPATDHSYGEWQMVTEATEQTEGIEKQVCVNCNDEQTRKTPKKEHVHIYESEVTAPTCTEQGFTLYSCECGHFYTDNYVTASGHTWSEWETTKEMTETEEGLRKRTCSTCNEEETETIPIHIHDFAWETSGDTRTMKCAGCGSSGITEYCYNGAWGYYDDNAANELWGYINTQRNATITNGLDNEGNVIVINVASLNANGDLNSKAKYRATEAAVNFSHAGQEHECLAWGQGNALDAWNSWFNSESHLRAIIEPDYSIGGIACFYYDSDGSGNNLTPIWVLELGS